MAVVPRVEKGVRCWAFAGGCGLPGRRGERERNVADGMGAFLRRERAAGTGRTLPWVDFGAWRLEREFPCRPLNTPKSVVVLGC